MKIDLYYDKDCPFCKSFAHYLTLKKDHQLRLYNAREVLAKIEEFRKQGFDINEGFIIEVDEVDLYQGADALAFLDKLTSKNLFYKNRYLYSAIKKFRELALRILKIDPKI